MDYEQFLSETQAAVKELKDKTNAQSKTVNKIQKCILDGDINALPKLYASLKDAAAEREIALKRLEEMTTGFDGHAYMSGGDYASQMLELCRQSKIDVQGSFPVYEMFPCRVTVNPDTQDVTVDRKRMLCLRPVKLVNDIKMELDKLSKAPFNAQLFVKELAAAYDLAILKLKASGKKQRAANSPVYALDLYDILTPMRRYKRDYTRNNFAYDLARLYAGDTVTLDDGRSLRFDTARDARKAIRILDSYGTEQFITTIRFS